MSTRRERAISEKMNGLGRALKASGAAKFYHNGDGAGFVWRAWHPLSWVCAPLLFIASVLVTGLPDTLRSRHEIGIGMNPWFIENPDRLHWG